MRPTRVSLSALGYSVPIQLDWNQSPFDAGLELSISSGGSLTASVLCTVDSLGPEAFRQVTASRATTVITVVDSGLGGSGPGGAPDGGTHGLSVGDLVQFLGDPVLAGWYNVASVVSSTSYTLTSPNSGTYTAVLGSGVITGRLVGVPSMGTLSARTLGNLTIPASCVVLDVTAYTSGTATLSVLQGRQG